MNRFSARPDIFVSTQQGLMDRSNYKKSPRLHFGGVQNLDWGHWEFAEFDDNQKLIMALVCLTMVAMPFGAGQGDGQSPKESSLIHGLGSMADSLVDQAFQGVDPLVPGSSPQVNRVMSEKCGIKIFGGRSEAATKINEELGMSGFQALWNRMAIGSAICTDVKGSRIHTEINPDGSVSVKPVNSPVQEVGIVAKKVVKTVGQIGKSLLNGDNVGDQPSRLAKPALAESCDDPPRDELGNTSLEAWLKTFRLMEDPGFETWQYYDGDTLCKPEDMITLMDKSGRATEIKICPARDIGMGMVLFGITMATPIPGDEWFAGAKLAGYIKVDKVVTLLFAVPATAAVLELAGADEIANQVISDVIDPYFEEKLLTVTEDDLNVFLTYDEQEVWGGQAAEMPLDANDYRTKQRLEHLEILSDALDFDGAKMQKCWVRPPGDGLNHTIVLEFMIPGGVEGYPGLLFVFNVDDPLKSTILLQKTLGQALKQPIDEKTGEPKGFPFTEQDCRKKEYISAYKYLKNLIQTYIQSGRIFK